MLTDPLPISPLAKGEGQTENYLVFSLAKNHATPAFTPKKQFGWIYRMLSLGMELSSQNGQ
ncbi:hypothetical protein CEQ28_004240 [Hafnia alvei]|nr:hypothetical protein CEQ28_004240 [Hafnia alvei]